MRSCDIDGVLQITGGGTCEYYVVLSVVNVTVTVRRSAGVMCLWQCGCD